MFWLQRIWRWVAFTLVYPFTTMKSISLFAVALFGMFTLASCATKKTEACESCDGCSASVVPVSGDKKALATSAVKKAAASTPQGQAASMALKAAEKAG